ncbi:UNVERIFIED_CONTAM: hypothetical protein GTU68_015531 [Idotea baltica]|nr:hypothetical protein [Idotea baltica]
MRITRLSMLLEFGVQKSLWVGSTMAYTERLLSSTARAK